MAIEDELRARLQTPLGPDVLESLNDNLELLTLVDRLVDQAARGGLDTADSQKRSRELREQLLRIKQSFFPGR